MKKLLLAAVVAVMGLPAMADHKTHAHGHGHSHGQVTYQYHHGNYGPSGNQIVVSCWRGPWREVIWDRPNGVFVDSLISVGYDYASAHAIAQRVCRDKTLVNNPGALKATMERIWADPGSHRKHNY